MILLHHPKSLDAPNLKETWQWVEANRDKYNIVTRFVDMKDVASTSHFLQEYWDKNETIIYLGHDVVPSEGMVEALLNCPYDLCAQAALIYPAHTGLKEPVIALRKRDEFGSLSWISENEEWADAFNLELTKFTPKAQQMIPVPECSWQMIDNEMSKASPIKAHVHWPLVKHNSW